MSDTRIGTEIAGYRIESVIGRGGMSVVYLARHEGLERQAALKLLAPELAENEGFRQRFVRESRIAAGLDHPNVIPVYDAGEADGVLYIAMRYVRGSDLKTLLAEHGPLDLPDVVRVMDQLGAALDAAHSEGLVHRDVKPANVLLSPPTPPAKVGHLYLADFGLTKKSLSGSGVTRSGQFVGTIDYVAPEQIRSEPVDGRADVYSMGAVLYECLTGEPPFVRDTEVAVMFAQLNDPPPAPTVVRPELPKAVDAVAERAMAKTPGTRYQSAGALAQAARQALGRLPDQPDGMTTPVPPVPARRRKALFAAVAGALIIVIAAIAAVIATRGEPSGGPTTPVSASPSSSPSLSVLNGLTGLVGLDPKTGRIAATAPLDVGAIVGGRSLIAGDGGIWVADPSTASVVKVDPATGHVEDNVRLQSRRADMSFAVGQSSVWVVAKLGVSAIPGDVDTLFRIDPGNDRVIARIPIGPGGEGVAVDRTGVWALLSQGSLVQIDAGTNRAKRPIPVASHASGIAVAGGSVWVSDNLEGAVYQVDPLSHQVHTIKLQGGADSIAADSTGVWVLDSASGTVVRIDPSSRDIGDPIRVGEKPSGIAVGAGSVWVADPGEGSVWRINAITGEPTSFPVGSDTHPGAVSVGEDGVWTTVESTQP